MGTPEQDRSILRELCTINGVNSDNLDRGSGHKTTKLESFFFGCPYIPPGCLAFFPALTVLKIVNQKFSRISGLEDCVGLTQLWICEAELECIEGLSQCTNLVSLYLYTNRIARIEGLNSLTKLQTLWLNGNLITCIEGLSCLLQLQELNLAHNRIIALGHSLDHLTKLTELNLSGNLLSSFLDVVHLSVLPKLTMLSLCDPMYPPNPVCSLCNYSTHLLYHLPSLHWLDGVGVASNELRLLIEGVVQWKKRFYKMKIHHIRSLARGQKQRLLDQLEATKKDTFAKMREVQRQLNTQQQVTIEEDKDLGETMSALDEILDRAERECSEHCVRLSKCADELCQQWTTELESGGNIRFIEGSTADPWYQSCVDIVQSRLSVSQDVCGVKVTGVTKIENRLQYSQFNNKMNTELAREEFSSLSSWKTLLDYLFIIRQPGCSSLDWCREPRTAHNPTLTNSVNMADALKIANLCKGQSAVEGELLLCKVFLGLCSDTQADNIHSVCVQTKGGGKEWRLMDSDLLLPEYIITVQYISNVLSTDPPLTHPLLSKVSIHPRLAMLDESTLLTVTGASDLSTVKELCFHDHHLTRFRLANGLSSLVSLTLSCNELNMADDLRGMPKLEVLNISFNKFSSLEGLKGLPKLRSLDARGNALTNIHETIPVLRRHTPSLEELDLRYNPWDKEGCRQLVVLGYLKTLKVFNGSLITEQECTEALRQVVSSHLSLSTLLSHAHTHPHAPHTLSLDPISQTLHSDTQYRPSQLKPHENWTFTVTSVCLNGLGLTKLAALDHLPNLRWLSLAHNSLSSLEVVNGCQKLEELVLDNNLLHELPALHTLTCLTHLSVTDNYLTSLSSLLPQLEFLDFSYNKVSSIDPLKCCVSLLELYASGNLLASTRGLFPLKTLTELTVCELSDNPVTLKTDYRHFVVYHCNSLKALDGIPVETSEVVLAREKIGGRLCQDLIFERHPDQELSAFRQLDFTHSDIKIVDLSPATALSNLASLNLEHNSLTSFSGLVNLHNLKVLCLNHNRVEQLASPREPLAEKVLCSLQVLHLAYNGIRSLSALQLSRIPSLRALFLQGNEVSSVEGLDGLNQLSELVLDRNKVKALQPGSFTGLTALRELHLEENRLKDLSHFSPLMNLQRLYLGLNKIQDFNQLEKLSPLCSLVELSVVSNPVSRRLQHRGLLVHLLPSLLSLDSVLVSPEERHSVESTFMHTQKEMESQGVDVRLSHGSLLKVMNVPFTHTSRKEPRAPIFSERRKGK